MRAYASLSIQVGRHDVVQDIFDVMEYSVGTSLDVDADAWSIAIGDPDGKLLDTLARDNEVRVGIYAVGKGSVEILHTGFADEIGIDHTGRLAMNGRDISAVAADTQAMPEQWSNARPHQIVAHRARKLRIGDRLALTPTAPFKKLSTDGSESEWELWWRLYRKRSMYLWVEPDGTINGGKLNYQQKPTYNFGTPMSNPGEIWVPVETLMWSKNTAQRIYECHVFGVKQDVGFHAQWKDKTIEHWIKKPIRILQDSDVHNVPEARVSAKDEIFDSQVGAVEWTVVIADPGFIVRQNRMAKVNIPNIGLNGEFFIVGSQVFNSTDGGQYQMVRMREKGYAISKKIPRDPGHKGESPTADTVANIQANLDVRWAEYFIRAAYTKHGPWDFKLFLAGMLAMCNVESGFRNVREGGSVEWYDPTGHSFEAGYLAKHKALFANEPATTGRNSEYGVGPMQLTTISYKRAADRLMDESFIDETTGGRWHPQFNILEAAQALREKLSPYEASPTTENFYAGVRAYNGSGAAAQNYMNTVKGLVDSEYMDMVEQAFKTEEIIITGPGDLTGYRNPFRDASGLIGARIDMGVDYTARNGSPIYAIGPAEITAIYNGWLSNSNWNCVAYRFTSGLYVNKCVFIAEYIRAEPGLYVGQEVDSTTIVARFFGPGAYPTFSGNGIEMGWSDAHGVPIALPYYPGGGRMTAMGVNMDRLVKAVGGVAGRPEHPPPVGSLPPGWPLLAGI